MADVDFYNSFPFTFSVSLPGGQTISLKEFSETGRGHYIPRGIVDRYGEAFFDRKTQERGGMLSKKVRTPRKTGVASSIQETDLNDWDVTEAAKALRDEIDREIMESLDSSPKPVETIQPSEVAEVISELESVSEPLQEDSEDTVDVSTWGMAEMRAFLEGRGIKVHHRIGEKKLREKVEGVLDGEENT